MNILGHGIDLIEIERMARAMERSPRFVLRVFTQEERTYLQGKGNAPQTAAGIFAAKEAVVKALGTGFHNIRFHDVMLCWDSHGKPSVSVKGQEHLQFLLSISHCNNYAAASVIAVRRDES